MPSSLYFCPSAAGFGRPLGRPQPASRTTAAGQLIGGGRPAKTATAGQRNGYGRRAERQRPFSGLAAADRPRPADRSTAITLQNGGGRHSAGWRRQPSYRVAAATPKSWQCCTVQGEALADGRRPGAATGVQGTAVSPPPSLPHGGRGEGRMRPRPLWPQKTLYVRPLRTARPPEAASRPHRAASFGGGQGRTLCCPPGAGWPGRAATPASWGGGGCCSRVALLFSKNQYRSWAGEAWLTVMYSMRIGIFSIQWNTDIKPRFRCLTARTRQAGSIIGQNEKRAVNKTAALPPCFSRANSSRCSVKQGLPLIGQQTD